MPRAHFYRPVLDREGNVVTDATVRVLQPGTTNLLAAPLYAGSSGGDTVPNPDQPTSGEIDFYLDQPQTVRIGVVRPNEVEKFFDDIDVGDPGNRETFTFTLAGSATVTAGSLRYYLDDSYEIIRVRASVGVPPTGSDLVIDVNKNGSTLFPDQAQRPRIVDGSNTGYSVPSNRLLAEGDYLTLDTDQIGSTNPGSNLVVQVRVRRTN